MLIPVSGTFGVLKARDLLLQRQQGSLLTQLYVSLAFVSVVSAVGCVQLIRRAFSIRKVGLDCSYAAKAPRMLRCSAWLMAMSFSGLIVFYCVMVRSPLFWFGSFYLLASMVGLAVTANFAARSALASSIAAEHDRG